VGGKDRLAVAELEAKKRMERFTEPGARSTLKEWNALGVVEGEESGDLGGG
jgi:hypothetical protein